MGPIEWQGLVTWLAAEVTVQKIDLAMVVVWT